MDRISPTFVNVYIFIRYMLGLLSSIFCLFVTELQPLMDVRFCFLLNIFRTYGQNLTRLYKCIYIDKICVNRIFTCYLLQIYNKVIVLDWQHNFVSSQYLEDKWIEFHQLL